VEKVEVKFVTNIDKIMILVVAVGVLRLNDWKLKDGEKSKSGMLMFRMGLELSLVAVMTGKTRAVLNMRIH